MPTPPPALDLHCPRCGWRRRWQPRCDALSVGDLPPERCPQCQHPDMYARRASTLQALWARLLRGRCGST